MPTFVATSSPQHTGIMTAIQRTLNSPSILSVTCKLDPEVLELHCLKFGHANLHPSHFTLCCKPPQCMLRVIRWGIKQNHMICWKQKCNLRATSQTHSWPRLDLEILAMKIHIGFEGAALGPTPMGNTLNVQFVNTGHRTKWLATMTLAPIFFQYPP